jgi:hypothetical protein
LPDPLASGSLLLVQVVSYLGFAALAADFCMFGVPMPFRSLARIDSSMALVGESCSGSLMLLPNMVHADTVLSPRAFAHIRPSLLASDVAYPGISAVTRSMSKLEVPPISVGASCMETSLSVLGFMHSGSFAPLKSTSHLDFSLLLSDVANSDTPMSLQTNARLGFMSLAFRGSYVGFPPLALDHASVGTSPSFRSFAYVSLFLTVVGMTWLESPSLVPESAGLGSLLSSQSIGRAEIFMLTSDCVNVGPPTFTRSAS